jgi:ABC-type uncharacterized transport system permease subunit
MRTGLVSPVFPPEAGGGGPVKDRSEGRASNWALPATLTLAAVLFVGARAFWLFGLRHYTGASA